MLLKLYQAGQPILRQSAKSVTKQQLASKHVQDVIDFMIATLRDAPGVGLAAPQVGEALRIVIIEDKVKYHDQVHPPLFKEQGRKAVALKVLVNPEIEIIDQEKLYYFEGCLSVDGYTAVVPRSRQVRVTALDRTGKPISFVAHDWLARIVQHEVDHLDGQLYIDRMISTSFMTLKNYTLLWRKALTAKIKNTFS
ncbi:MAG: peptide deformylase [Candidatus Saccharibacteria bacterium]|nr:peptide deformylase [Candidatus Saccharibacteria bacterium]